MSLNVRDFGALGQSTDDTAAFLAAHSALPATGGALYIPTGSYLVNDLILTKSVRLVGDGPSSVLVSLDPSAQEIVRLYGPESEVYDLAFHGTKTTAGGTLRAINVYGPRCRLARLLVTGVSIGVDFEPAASFSRLDDSSFERLVSSSGNGTSVLMEGVRGVKVVNVRVDSASMLNLDGTPGAAIFMAQIVGGDGASENEVVLCSIYDHPQVGIALGSTTYAQWPAFLGQGRDNKVSHNTIVRCGSQAGGPAGSAVALVANMQNTRITHNRVTTTRGHGISVEAALYTSGAEGTPKGNEIPTNTLIADNILSGIPGTPVNVTNAPTTIQRNNDLH